MEYYREPGNRIQAGFALNAGKLLVQYESLTASMDPREKYDATLAICVLQSLLTNCAELLTAMRKDQKGFFRQAIPAVRSRWGLSTALIVQNTFPGTVTLERVLIHLRNALSHPTGEETTPYPSTGYTTSAAPSKLVECFQFTDSPWVNKGAIFWRALSPDEDKVRKTADALEAQYQSPGFLEVVARPDGTYGASREGRPFVPVFRIGIPLETIKDLARHLANHLAQPTNEQWDGKSIRELVA